MRVEGNIAQFLLSPEIRSRVKTVIRPWMFETEVYRAFSMTITKDQFDKIDIDHNVFLTTIKTKYPSLKEHDIKEIERLIDTYNDVDPDDISHILSIITDHFKTKIYAKGLDCLSENKLEEAEDYINRAINLTLTSKEYTVMSDSTKLCEMLERKFPKDGKYFKSSFGLINDTCTFKGYRRGDLIQIVAPTGRGKTSMMCQETCSLAHQGFKVGYALIGDNEEDDIGIKLCSYFARVNILDIVDNLKEYIDTYSEQMDNISSMSYPMYAVTVQEILADFKRIKKERGLDVLFIDYDQNIAMAHEGMYESGGIIYAALKAFAQVEDCVVIVASQPKIGFWNNEVMGVESANESARKQANIDMMITFNWNPECQQVGTMHIAKIRRGQNGARSRIKFNHHISELKEITEEEYDNIVAKSRQQEETIPEYTTKSLRELANE